MSGIRRALDREDDCRLPQRTLCFQVVVDAPRPGRIYLPGSFNPMHEGHRCCCSCVAIAGTSAHSAVAQKKPSIHDCCTLLLSFACTRKFIFMRRKLLAAGRAAAGGQLDGCYEMSVGNPDKGMLPLEEVQRRVQPFLESGDPLVVTQVGGLSGPHGSAQQRHDAGMAHTSGGLPCLHTGHSADGHERVVWGWEPSFGRAHLNCSGWLQLCTCAFE